MEFSALIQRAGQIRERYENYEKSQYGRAWTDEEIALGFVGDVGDLVKLIQVKNGVRHIPDAQAALEHELADCLWSVIVLAQAYDIDLEQAFTNTMDILEQDLSQIEDEE